jgi:DNA gyrase/topoisomerase IV subunit A
MAGERRIVLIPQMPEEMVLDFVFRTEAGTAVQASDEEIQALQERGVPVATLYDSGNEYAAAVVNLTKEEAIAVVESAQNTALAALTPEERDEFGVA